MDTRSSRTPRWTRASNEAWSRCPGRLLVSKNNVTILTCVVYCVFVRHTSYFCIALASFPLRWACSWQCITNVPTFTSKTLCIHLTDSNRPGRVRSRMARTRSCRGPAATRTKSTRPAQIHLCINVTILTCVVYCVFVRNTSYFCIALASFHLRWA